MVGNVASDDGIGADDRVMSDADAAEYLRAGADLHPVADFGSAKRIVEAGIAERHAVTYQAIVTDDSGTVNDDAAMMLDAQSSADDGRGADGDAANDLDQLV
jgi:hypothetical protein